MWGWTRTVGGYRADGVGWAVSSGLAGSGGGHRCSFRHSVLPPRPVRRPPMCPGAADARCQCVATTVARPGGDARAGHCAGGVGPACLPRVRACGSLRGLRDSCRGHPWKPASGPSLPPARSPHGPPARHGYVRGRDGPHVRGTCSRPPRGSAALPGHRGPGVPEHRAVGLASSLLAETYHRTIDHWSTEGFDFPEGERAADAARAAVARLIGADAADVALIPSLSSAAGLVAAQLGPAAPGRERRHRRAGVQLEPLPLAPAGRQGVRRAPGALPQRRSRARRRRPSASTAAPGSSRSAACRRRPGTAPTSPRSARSPGTSGRSSSWTPRSWSGRCRSPTTCRTSTCWRPPTTSSCSTRAAAWATATCPPRRAGSVHADQRGLAGGRGPVRELLRSGDGPLPHRVALRQLDQLAGRDRQRGRARRVRRLRPRRRLRPQPRAGRDAPAALAEVGWEPVDLPEQNRSTIVSVPLGDREPLPLLGALSEQGVVASARDGNLRCRSTSTTTRTTSRDSSRRWPPAASWSPSTWGGT